MKRSTTVPFVLLLIYIVLKQTTTQLCLAHKATGKSYPRAPGSLAGVSQ
jgi:hypothetical protein